MVNSPTDEKALDDLGRNADLYVFNQDDSDNQQVDDVRSGRQPHSQQGAGRLVLTKSRRRSCDLNDD